LQSVSLITVWLYNFFCRKNVGSKAEHKMLVKSTPGVNFINILRKPFVPIFLRQKITKPKHYKRKAAQSTFVQKFFE